MRILAFESSAKTASVALLQDGMLCAEYYQNSGQTHSRTLMKMAEDLLCNCDLTADDLDAVAVAAGPGSFTGVRIGVAAAKGLAWGKQLPCYGVSTLEAMASTAAHMDGIVCCAMDARRAQVYHALFRAKDGEFTRLREDCAISIEELALSLKNFEEPIFLVGDGAQLCYNTLGNEIKSLRLLPEAVRMQRASGVAAVAWKQSLRGEAPNGGELVPNYLRLSQAEREKQNRMNQGRE